MSHQIKKVYPLEGMKILAYFNGEESRVFDFSTIVERFPVFAKLNNRSLFELVQVDPGGWGISWNDDVDFSAEDIWNEGEKPKEQG